MIDESCVIPHYSEVNEVLGEATRKTLRKLENMNVYEQGIRIFIEHLDPRDRASLAEILDNEGLIIIAKKVLNESQ